MLNHHPFSYPHTCGVSLIVLTPQYMPLCAVHEECSLDSAFHVSARLRLFGTLRGLRFYLPLCIPSIVSCTNLIRAADLAGTARRERLDPLSSWLQSCVLPLTPPERIFAVDAAIFHGCRPAGLLHGSSVLSVSPRLMKRASVFRISFT